MRKIVLTAIAALCILTGCNEYDINEILLSKTEISLSKKGADVYTLNPDKGQFGFRPGLNEYRVINDDLSGWFVFRSDIRPSMEGEKVTADLEWLTKTDIGSVKEEEFIVKKTGDNGTIWLWCEARKIGLVIKDI